MGQCISPRYKRAAIAATKDEELCKYLASMDILRVGKRREIQLALKMLGNICYESQGQYDPNQNSP
jgi:hypothetical protein